MGSQPAPTLAPRSCGAGSHVTPEESQAPFAVVFIIFNRPELTRRAFVEIARARPPLLFVVADGPRSARDGDAEAVAQAREVVSRIDWPCVVRRNYSAVNMGCGQRVSTGLSWAFSYVDDAIVLEDDCIPTPSFFTFCREMLDRYRNDRRVFAVSGTSFQPKGPTVGHYFSKYPLMWGWATWSDRWACYQFAPARPLWTICKTWWRRPLALLYWWKVCQSVARGALDTWDVQWILTLWRHRALACRPSHNLVANVGFGGDATHTKDAMSPLASLEVAEDIHLLVTRLGPVRADARRDRVDERVWALIGVRSVVLMCLPWVRRLSAARRRL